MLCRECENFGNCEKYLENISSAIRINVKDLDQVERMIAINCKDYKN